MRHQSSGRKSHRRTWPAVADSMAAQWVGGAGRTPLAICDM